LVSYRSISPRVEGGGGGKGCFLGKGRVREPTNLSGTLIPLQRGKKKETQARAPKKIYVGKQSGGEPFVFRGKEKRKDRQEGGKNRRPIRSKRIVGRKRTPKGRGSHAEIFSAKRSRRCRVVIGPAFSESLYEKTDDDQKKSYLEKADVLRLSTGEGRFRRSRR